MRSDRLLGACVLAVGLSCAGDAIVVLRPDVAAAPGAISRPDAESSAHPVVVALPEGGAAAAWLVWEDRGPTHVEAAVMDAAGDWELAQVLSDARLLAGRPRLAVEPEGRTHAVWAAFDPTTGLTVIQEAVREPTRGTWGLAHALTPPMPGTPAVDVAFGMGAGGDGAVVWATGDGRSDVWAVRRAGAAGAWGDVERVAQDDRVERLGVVVRPDGSGVAVWQSGVGRSAIHAARFADRGWSAAEDVFDEPDRSATDPVVAADAGGNVTVAWTEHRQTQPGRFEPDSIRAATAGPGLDGWPSRRVSRPRGAVFRPELAVAADGAAVVGWLGDRADPLAAFWTGVGWTHPEGLQDDAAMGRSAVAMTGAGTAALAWLDGEGDGAVVRYASGSADAGWLPGDVISPAGSSAVDTDDLHVVATTDGAAVAVWSAVVVRTSRRVVQAARVDVDVR